MPTLPNSSVCPAPRAVRAPSLLGSRRRLRAPGVFLLGAALALGCGSSSPDASPEAPAADAAAGPADGAATPAAAAAKDPPAETPPPPPVPLPDGTVLPGAPTVALVGHGLRIELRPPFQVARMGEALGEHADLVVWSWWDVNVDAAGKHGRAGLYNISVVPAKGAVTSGPVLSEIETKGKRTQHLLRVGKGGPFLRLPEGHDALGGMGTVGPGPADPVWKFQVDDGPLLEWKAPLMVHSGDPAKGEAVRFLQRPEKPWGPWKEGG